MTSAFPLAGRTHREFSSELLTDRPESSQFPSPAKQRLTSAKAPYPQTNQNKDVSVSFTLSSNQGWVASDDDVLRGEKAYDEAGTSSD